MNRCTRTWLLAIVFPTLLAATPAAAQDEDPEPQPIERFQEHDKASILVGGGLFSNEDETDGEMGFLLRADLENRHEAYILQYTVFYSEGLFSGFGDDLFCGLFSSDCDDEDEFTSYSDFSFMYGFRSKKMTYAAGLGYLRSSNNLDSSLDYSTSGLALNARYNGRILDLVGHANLNDESSYLMIGLSYELEL